MLSVGLATENWTGDARFYEYTKAADPIGNHTITPVPCRVFPASLHASGPTGEVMLDLSEDLDVAYPATSPALLASFVRILAGEELRTRSNATSELYFVLSGQGSTTFAVDRVIAWAEGDFVTLPSGCAAIHAARVDSVLYRVLDTPLLDYLGAQANHPKFLPTLFEAARVRAELERAAASPDAGQRSRIAVLLANAEAGATLTVTHTLWAMFGLLPAGHVQLAHRHQSVALDLIVDCQPGCFSLVGDELDDQGRIVDPIQVDWEPGGAFVTPPGKWHSHHNETGAPAHLVPIQDAGLHTYLRTLDIRFFRPPA